jgi:hypothetical protein
MGVSNADRQRAFQIARNKAGFVKCAVWIPPAAIAEFQRAAELARHDPKLTIGRMVDTETGKLRGLKRAPAPLLPDDGVRSGAPT